MKKLDNYIIEKLKIGKSTKHQYNYFPKNRDELRKILEERLAEDKDADLNDIDVSEIIDMGEYAYKGLFDGLDPHDIDISRWNVSKVRNMSCMFYWCENFNCDLSNWDVSRVEDMRGMFAYCKKFKAEGLENWKVTNNTKMKYMFDNCDSLKNKPSWYINHK